MNIEERFGYKYLTNNRSGKCAKEVLGIIEYLPVVYIPLLV